MVKEKDKSTARKELTIPVSGLAAMARGASFADVESGPTAFGVLGFVRATERRDGA